MKNGSFLLIFWQYKINIQCLRKWDVRDWWSNWTMAGRTGSQRQIMLFTCCTIMHWDILDFPHKYAYSPMGVFGAHYDMNTFSLAERSLYPRFLCLQKWRQKNSVSLCQITELWPKPAGVTADSQHEQTYVWLMSSPVKETLFFPSRGKRDCVCCVK